MADQIDSIIKLRRGVDAQRRGIVFDNGEIVFSTDIKRVFIGDASTEGANLVGNKNTIGTTPDNTGIINDLFFETTSNVLYMLSSDAGPDVLGNYARVSQRADETTIKLINGVYSINDTYFNDPSTGFLRLSGGTMTGYITLHAQPISAMHATTKNYVDTLVAANAVDINDLETRFVNVTGDTMTGNLTIQSANFTVQGTAQVDSTLTVGNSSNFNGNVNFKKNSIEKFKTVVKSVHLAAPNYTYQLTPDDTGCVLSVTSDNNGFISIPNDLDIGFNVLAINKSTSYNLSFIPSDLSGGILIRNAQGKITINDAYGICNMVVIADAEILIAGDLS
jgi:hypothetical protein